MRAGRRTSTHLQGRAVALALPIMATLVLVALFSLRDSTLSASEARPELQALRTIPVTPAVERRASPPVAELPSLASPPFLPHMVPILAPAPEPDTRTYHGKKFRLARTLTLRVTAYAPDPRCTYPFPGTTTASGLPVTTNGGRLVAADTSLIPLHALVVVPGYAAGNAVPVLDRGGAIKGHRLDVLLPTFEQAQSWGVRTLSVKIFLPAK